MNKRQTGSRYEETAAAFLTSKGYRVLERNFRCRQGEIDLICRHGRYLVFAEVKYRSGLSMGSPAEAVDARKQERIRRGGGLFFYSPPCWGGTSPAGLTWWESWAVTLS